MSGTADVVCRTTLQPPLQSDSIEYDKEACQGLSGNERVTDALTFTGALGLRAGHAKHKRGLGGIEGAKQWIERLSESRIKGLHGYCLIRDSNNIR